MRLFPFLIMAALAFISSNGRAWAADDGPTKNELKAAFLANFGKYVSWPPGTFTVTNSPLVIGVLAETKASSEIKRTLTGRSINGRPVDYCELVDEGDARLGGCHIVFISSSHQRKTRALLSSLKGASALTVGENDDFLESGGIMNLKEEGNKIALEVNLIAATEARLKISSKLLSVASAVKGREK